MKVYHLFFISWLVFLTSILQSQDFTESNLPIVIIETDGQNIPDEPKINVTMGIIDNGTGELNHVDDEWNDFNGMVGIEVRGSSSQWFFPKDQYAVETRDSAGNNLNVSLLGLPPENDWILHAPYSDKTLMRNALIYKLARDMGHYASRTVYCELVLNGDYQGIYILMEKIKRDPNRVDIAQMDSDDILGDSLTGGYIIKIDKNGGVANEGWDSSFPPYPGAWQTVEYKYHYPKQQFIESQQKIFIQQFVNEFESIMDPDDYNHPETGYRSLTDMDSFVDFIMLNELAKNIDAYRLSTFLHKDRNSSDPRMKAGPVWDFNITLGNVDYFDGFNPEGWFVLEPVVTWETNLKPFWWIKLMEDVYFYHRMVLHWNQYRMNILSDSSLYGFIDQTVELLDEAQERNFERWPVLGEYIWPNYFVGDTYEEEVEYLEGFIEERVAWMDEQLKLQPMFSEINYKSSSDLMSGDWIELYHAGPDAMDISGWTIQDSSDTYFTFPSNTILLADHYLVVCEDMDLFSSVYPDVVNVLGELDDNLPDLAGHLALYSEEEDCVDILSYKNANPWPGGANGSGNTIELMHYLTDNSLGESWQVSQLPGGSPGDTTTIAPVPELFINEFMAENESFISDEYGEFDDWIEIYNAGDTPVDVGGKYMTDSLAEPMNFQIPTSSPSLTTILPGGYLVLWADNQPEQGPLHIGFKLSKEMEQIGLFMGDGVRVIDSLSFGEQVANVCYGRYPDGDSPWYWLDDPTPGYSNTLTVGIHEQKAGIRLYPNPVDEYIHWESSPISEDIQHVKIYNLYGVLLEVEETRSAKGRIDVREFPPGVYLFEMEYGEHKEIERFIIK